MNSKILSYQQVLTQQSKVLNSKKCLIDLFDKIQKHPPFSIPQNSIVINLDNITFGPDKYTIVISQNQQQTFRIIYYSILFYLFEKNPENKGNHIYQKLLHFIFTHDLCLLTPQFTLSDDQVKTYLVKFLHLLQRQKNKHKLIVQELSNLPPMDILFNHLFRKMTGEDEVVIQLNAGEIQSAFKKQLDFTFQFLTNQTFLFENSYVIDIRYFDESCQFYIRHETQQNIKSIRDQILLAQSAHFNNESGNYLGKGLDRNRMFNKNNVKVIKKSTVKSIGWVDQQDQPQQKPKQLPSENTEFWTSCTLNEQQTFQNDSSKGALKQTLQSSDGEGFNNIFLNNVSVFNFKEQKTPIFGKSYFQYKQRKQSVGTQSNQSIDSQQILKTKNNQSSKSSLQSLKRLRNEYFPKKNHKLYTQQSQTDIGTKFPGTLSVSNSIQHIEVNRISQNSSYQKREVRIPKFIYERERARRPQIYQQNRQSFSSTIKLATLPRITFTYSNR